MLDEYRSEFEGTLTKEAGTSTSNLTFEEHDDNEKYKKFQEALRTEMDRFLRKQRDTLVELETNRWNELESKLKQFLLGRNDDKVFHFIKFHVHLKTDIHIIAF